MGTENTLSLEEHLRKENQLLRVKIELTSGQFFSRGMMSPDYKHGVIFFFNKGVKDLSCLHNFETKLYDLLTNPEIGDYDGHEICMDLSHGSLYFYGHNAEVVFKMVKPLLETEAFLIGATAVLTFNRYSENEKSIEVVVGEN